VNFPQNPTIPVYTNIQEFHGVQSIEELSDIHSDEGNLGQGIGDQFAVLWNQLFPFGTSTIKQYSLTFGQYQGLNFD